jgi:hypothetical protein
VCRRAADAVDEQADTVTGSVGEAPERHRRPPAMPDLVVDALGSVLARHTVTAVRDGDPVALS